jgi:3-hydroxyisobutyrate dehydrogenase
MTNLNQNPSPTGALPRVGIAGVGKMGAVIAARLLSLGFPVAVWNRSPNRAQALAPLGAQVVATPAALAQCSDVVLSLLTNEAAVDAVYNGPDGLLASVNGSSVAGKTFIDMSTVRPTQAPETARRAAAAHAHFLECPVSGSIGPAKDGKLIGFVGGDVAVLATVRSVLDALCKRVEPVGPHGAGATMKLAINLPLMVYWQTLGEALSLIEPLGLDPQRVVDIFSESSGGPNMLKVRGGMIAQALTQGQSDTTTVNIATLRKDVRAMVEQGENTGRRLPLTAQTLANFDEAGAGGLDGADCTQLLVWWLNAGKVAGV